MMFGILFHLFNQSQSMPALLHTHVLSFSLQVSAVPFRPTEALLCGVRLAVAQLVHYECYDCPIFR